MMPGDRADSEEGPVVPESAGPSAILGDLSCRGHLARALLLYRISWLRTHGSVVDADVVDQAGEESAWGESAGGSPVFRWTWAPGEDLALEWPDPVVKTANANLLVRQNGTGWRLVARAPSNGTLWQHPLRNEPARWAVAADALGRVIVVLRDGRVLCFGSLADEVTGI